MPHKQKKGIHKMTVVGPSNVGKSQLCDVITINTVNYDYVPTIGVDFLVRNTTINNVNHKIYIWDMGGCHRYRPIVCTYFNNTNTALVVYNVFDKYSFEQAKTWVNDIRAITNPTIPNIVLLGNNTIHSRNSNNERKVTVEEGERYAVDNSIKYMEFDLNDTIQCNNMIDEIITADLDSNLTVNGNTFYDIRLTIGESSKYGLITDGDKNSGFSSWKQYIPGLSCCIL
jgi:small GTP-binding protein